MFKSKKAIAFIMAAAIAVTMLFSVVFAAKEADHSCSGIECPICSLIHSFVNNFGSALKSSGGFMLFSALLCLCAVALCEKFRARNNSLILLKVKLSN